MSINITNLRPEIQTLVNSDPNKYDPNANGKIDDGVELSQLLSEYGCTEKQLISKDGEEMFTYQERNEIKERGAECSREDVNGIFLSSLAAGGIGVITTGVQMNNAFNNLEYAKGVFKNIPKHLRIGNGIGLAIGLGFTALSIFGFTKGISNAQKSGEKQAKLEIKAEQSKKGTATLQERLQHEEEMRQREAALKQDELEYKERVQAATTGIDTKLKTAEKRAKNINNNLKEAESKVETKAQDKVAE